MNKSAYCTAAIAAHRARIVGVTDPDELITIAVDAMVDSDAVIMDVDFDFNGPEAQDALDSVFKALQDLHILPVAR